MKGYRKYFRKKIIWFIVTFFVAVILNFILPRLMPGDPVQSITGQAVAGVTDQAAIQRIYENYAKEFGTDKPMIVQFITYFGKVFKGDFGRSFSQYPRPVGDIIANSIGWTLALQLPAIIAGWMIGNLLGAVAAYIRKGFDKVLMPVSLFISSIPAFGLAIIMLIIFALNLKIAPIGNAYDVSLLPDFSWQFVKSVIIHYQLPFWSVVIMAIGGQAIGMRSMSIYELNADYVKYSRFLGIKDRKIVGYVFRNAMLPQITGLALSLGTMVSGALVVEIIFSYPGLGKIILTAISTSDYPLLSATTLIVTIMVLLSTFAIDIVYAFIDPRVKAAQFN